MKLNADYIKKFVIFFAAICINISLIASNTAKSDIHHELGAFKGNVEIQHPEWFKESFLDFEEDIADATASGKHLIIYFWQDGCPYCNELIEKNFARIDTGEFIRSHFDLVAINIWGDREVVQVGGDFFTEKTLASALKVSFTPTLLFFNKDKEVVLRLNGYHSSNYLNKALDWVANYRYNTKETFEKFILKYDEKKSTKPLRSESFFSDGPFDLSIIRDKPLAIYFENNQCDECETFHKNVLNQSIIREYAEKMRSIQIDTNSKTPLIDMLGRSSDAQSLVQELNIIFAPTVVFLDVNNKEIIRLEGEFRTFHTLGAMEYVSSKAYLEEPNFQRFLTNFSKKLRGKGFDVDIWSYDSPIIKNN